MESMLNFINKFTDVVKNHLEETKVCIGKEVVDNTANKSGICVDKIKLVYGARFSMLGHNYSETDKHELETVDEDVLVCQGNNGMFFIPVSNVEAVGESVILVKQKLDRPEIANMNRRREEVFRKYFKTRQSIKRVLPNVENPVKRSKKKKSPLRIFH